MPEKERKIDNIEFLEKMRELWANNEGQKAKEFREEYGDQQVDLGDVEEINSYTIQLIATNLVNWLTSESFKNDAILEILYDKNIITQEEWDNIDQRANSIREGTEIKEENE